MTAMLVGVLAPILLILAKGLRSWLTIRARAALIRATAQLPTGSHVHGRDVSGTWSVRRTIAKDRK